MAAGPGRDGHSSLARRRAHCRHRPRRRDRRFSSLRQATPAHGLSRPDAERTVFRRQDLAWRDHQGEKHASQTRARRGSPDLSPAGADRAQILKRNESLPQSIKDIAWKAQVRPCARHRRFIRTGKPASLANVAIAKRPSASSGSPPSFGRLLRCAVHIADPAAAERTRTATAVDYGYENHKRLFRFNFFSGRMG